MNGVGSALTIDTPGGYRIVRESPSMIQQSLLELERLRAAGETLSGYLILHGRDGREVRVQASRLAIIEPYPHPIHRDEVG